MDKPSEIVLKLIEESPLFSIQDLLEVLDPESIYKLMVNYGGNTIFIPKIDKILAMERKEKIKKDFYSGTPIQKLAKKYGMTSRYIRTIVTEEKDDTRQKQH